MLDNNTYVATLAVSPFVEEEIIEFEIKLDNAPGATYWEILDASGNILYFDGNQNIAHPNASDGDKYQTSLSTHFYEIALPSAECYEFRIYDSFGGGICCGDGLGYYKLKNQNGDIILEGGEFDFEETRPFGLSNNLGAQNNASIIEMAPLPEDFCHTLTFSPQVKIQNLGGNEITELEVEIKGNWFTYLTHDFSTSIQPGKIKTINLPEISIASSDDITVSIKKVNNEIDVFDYRNSKSRSAFRRTTTPVNWTIDIYSGTNAHEIYWQIIDEDSMILISGGNEVVGASGGGQGIATPSDQGAYNNNEPIIEDITMPGPGCYQLMILDDGGNGFSGGGFGVPSPHFRIRNNTVGIIVGTDGNFLEAFHSNIEIEDPNSINQVTDNIQELKLSPNPVSDLLMISLEDIENSSYSISILNAVTGQQVLSEEIEINTRNISYQVSVNDFPAGIFIVNVESEFGRVSKRFVVSR